MNFLPRLLLLLLVTVAYAFPARAGVAITDANIQCDTEIVAADEDKKPDGDKKPQGDEEEPDCE